VSKFTLYLTIATGMLSAVMAPKIGALSDRYGRVRFLALTSVGALLSEVVTILAATFPETISYKWLLIGAVFDGISGSSTAALSTTHAYAADCTPPPKRGVAFGYFHACLFGGIALGPLAAAAVVQFTGQLIMVFYYALAIHIFFNIFILSVVPESLSKKRQKLARERFAAEDDDIISGSYSWAGIDWLNVYRQGNILAPLKILWPTGPGSSGHLRANLILLSAVDTMIFGVAMGSLTVVVYYLGYQFGWETSQTSGFISAVSTARVAALVIALPLFIKFVRTRHANKQRRESGFATPERNSGSDNLDLYIIRFATLVEALGYLGYALARTGPVFLLSGVIASCGGVASPTLQSALTKHIPRDRVGQLLGATGLLHGLARIVCPVLFNLIYASTVGTLPQAVFVVLSGSIGLAFLLSWLIRPHGKDTLFSNT
jgi:MFS family permease